MEMSTSDPPPPPPPPPPSPPPKSPSVFTSASHASHASHSTTSLTTTDYPHSPARPTHAQRAVRQQASIHLTRANMGTNEDESENRDVSAAMALAPTPTPTTVMNPNRPPSLSFLTYDPAYTPSSSSHNLPGSASASASRRSSVLSGRRISGLTTRSFQSGMADIDVSSPETGLEAEELNPRLSEIPSFSFISGMAVQAPSPPLPAKPKSLKSATSTSSKTRKRASNSTIHRRSFQRKYGKWEWEADMSPLLERDSKRREETMELAALLGRATVLERMLKAGKRVSGTPVSSLKHLASTKSSASRRSPSRRSQSTPRRSLSISIRSVRRHLSRRLGRKPSSNVEAGDEDAFTEIESQSGFGSVPPVEVLLYEKERGWVVLLPEKSEDTLPPPLPEKDGGCLPSPTCFSSTKTDDMDSRTPSEVEREVYVQSPHLGHRSPDHHRRQSVLSYISVGRWSASTQGRRRKRGWVIGLTIGSVVGVIVLTGILAGFLSRRSSD